MGEGAKQMKGKLNVDTLEVEEWDNTSGALLRFYEKNPPSKVKRKDESFYCEIVRIFINGRNLKRNSIFIVFVGLYVGTLVLGKSGR